MHLSLMRCGALSRSKGECLSEKQRRPEIAAGQVAITLVRWPYT